MRRPPACPSAASTGRGGCGPCPPLCVLWRGAAAHALLCAALERGACLLAPLLGLLFCARLGALLLRAGTSACCSPAGTAWRGHARMHALQSLPLLLPPAPLPRLLLHACCMPTCPFLRCRPLPLCLATHFRYMPKAAMDSPLLQVWRVAEICTWTAACLQSQLLPAKRTATLNEASASPACIGPPP